MIKQFKGTRAQYGLLRKALAEMHDQDMKSSMIINQIRMKYMKEVNLANLPHYSTLDKFRKNQTSRINEQLAKGVWLVISHSFPNLLAAEDNTNDGEDYAFNALNKFFDVHKHRNTRLIRFLLGRFQFYHYSEIFHNYPDDLCKAVVVGQMDIRLNDTVIEVLERQAYDGRLGPAGGNEEFIGYCLPKGPNLCFIMKDVVKETPKFYVISEKFEDSITGRTMWMRGYMLKSSDKPTHFYSPFYAIRVEENQEVKCNILKRNEISDNVIYELNKGQAVMYETG